MHIYRVKRPSAYTKYAVGVLSLSMHISLGLTARSDKCTTSASPVKQRIYVGAAICRL